MKSTERPDLQQGSKKVPLKNYESGVKPKRSARIIRSLGPRHREQIAKHLLALDKNDRYLRFGHIATDEQIQLYVESLNFKRDNIFGIYNSRLDLIAMAHLAYSLDRTLDYCAEFGVSVLVHARGKGYGKLLFERSITHAKNEGVKMIFIQALTENIAMLNIAKHAGARVENDGSESNAYLLLPDATFDSQISEVIDEQMAQINYRLKVQARKFWDMLASIQEVRQGVRAGRHQSSE